MQAIRNILLKGFLILVLLSSISTDCTAQKQVFKISKNIPGPFTDFAVDILGNLYLLNPQNSLKKISEKGDSAGVYNDVKSFGKLNSVNVTNPLKILLYYQQFSTIVVLDRFLNRRNTIDLRKQNIFTVKAISPSYDNNVWIFDEQDYKLKKIGDDGRTLSETQDMRMLLDSVPSPARIIDRDGFVYLYDPQKGIYIFDYYGAYKTRLSFLNWKDIEVIEKNIYGFDEKNYYIYADKKFDLQTFPLPVGFKEFSLLRLGNNKVYILKEGQINVYQLQ